MIYILLVVMAVAVIYLYYLVDKLVDLVLELQEIVKDSLESISE